MQETRDQVPPSLLDSQHIWCNPGNEIVSSWLSYARSVIGMQLRCCKHCLDVVNASFAGNVI